MGSEFTNILMTVLRISVATAAGFVAYLMSGPLVRGVYRLFFQRPIKRTTLRFGRIVTGILIGVLVYFLLALGLGGGWGTGGPDSGNRKAGKDKHKQIKPKDDKKPPEIKEGILEIEVPSKDRYPGEERRYLINRKEPAVDLKGVDEFLKKNHKKIKAIHLLLTPTSEALYSFRDLNNYVSQEYHILVIKKNIPASP